MRYSLRELTAGRIPDLSRAAAGRIELEFMLRSDDTDQDLRDAAALLELLVATEGRVAVNIGARVRDWLAALDKSNPT